MENCFDKIYNAFLVKKMGHAFLIETNSIEDSIKKILELAKKVNCPFSYEESCNKECDLCFQIDNLCLPSIKYIEATGQVIKKEQIIDVKNKFNNNSLITKYNIYIVKNAEKLNSSSANVLLKFLEDPGTETIAFFLLNNKKNVIPTIKSRCQIYSYNLDIKESLNDDLVDLFTIKAEKIFDNIIKENSSSFLKNKNIVVSDIKERKEQEAFLNFIFHLISDEIRYRLSNKDQIGNLIFKEYKTKTLINFTQQTKETIEKASYNVNMELLLDDYFIKVGELVK